MNRHTTKLNAFIIAAMIAVSSCNNATTTTTTNTADSVAATVDTAMNNVKQGAENAVNSAENAMSSGNVDSNFVVKAATTNNAELKILQEGIDMGTDKALIAHARMMLSDHKKLGEKVMAYANTKGYVLPDGDNGKSDDEMAKLTGLGKGKDFDKEWAAHMVAGHESAISMFENAQNNVKDPGLKDIITGALPTLHEHLDMMKQLQDKLNK